MWEEVDSIDVNMLEVLQRCDGHTIVIVVWICWLESERFGLKDTKGKGRPKCIGSKLV